MPDYPLIEDHGLIGDLQTAALVATDGTIDWFCWPRFDSPSIFASLLDHGRGGRFRIAPASGDFVTTQMYFPESTVLDHQVHERPRCGRARGFHADSQSQAGHVAPSNSPRCPLHER